jgi:hypothetical protein
MTEFKTAARPKQSANRSRNFKHLGKHDADRFAGFNVLALLFLFAAVVDFESDAVNFDSSIDGVESEDGLFFRCTTEVILNLL